MNAVEFEKIKDKINKAKDKDTKAQGAIEQIMGQLKKDFAIGSIEEAKEKLAEIDRTIEKEEVKLDKIYEELEELTEWETI